MGTHTDKVAIVTGSRLGIGHGIAKLLAARGAKVVLVNRQDASNEAAAIGNGAIAITADVAQEADCARVATQVDQTFGRADILVHAAGIYPMASLDQLTLDEWRGVMAVTWKPILSARARSCR